MQAWYMRNTQTRFQGISHLCSYKQGCAFKTFSKGSVLIVVDDSRLYIETEKSGPCFAVFTKKQKTQQWLDQVRRSAARKRTSTDEPPLDRELSRVLLFGRLIHWYLAIGSFGGLLNPI